MATTSTIVSSNKTENNTTEILFVGYSDELLEFATLACICFVVVGVPGNLLTIVALSRGKQVNNCYCTFTLREHI